MKNLKKLMIPACWLVILFMFLILSESNAQVRKMTFKDLTNESTAVLYGKCKKITSEWNENKSMIMTYITIEPEEYLKGNLGSKPVIAIPGGRVGDIVYEVSEVPFFTEEEEVVAFIWTSPAGKNLITGGYHGKMKIIRDRWTQRRMVLGLGLDDEGETPDHEGWQPGKFRKMFLEEFKVKIKAYLNN